MTKATITIEMGTIFMEVIMMKITIMFNLSLVENIMMIALEITMRMMVILKMNFLVTTTIF